MADDTQTETTPQTGGPGNNDGGATGGTPAAKSGAGDKAFTQADVDRFIADRLKEQEARFTRKAEADRKAAEETARRAQMTEADQLRAEADEAKAKLAALDTALAAERATLAVREAATELGYSPKLAAALTAGRAFALGDDGRPQPQAVREALKALAREYPELALVAGTGATNHARGAQQPFDPKSLRASDPRLWTMPGQ